MACCISRSYPQLANAIIALVSTLLQVEKRAGAYMAFVNSKTLLEILISLALISFVWPEMERQNHGRRGQQYSLCLPPLVWLWKRNVRMVLTAGQVKVMLALGLSARRGACQRMDSMAWSTAS